jgi:hypothetical protein
MMGSEASERIRTDVRDEGAMRGERARDEWI